MLERGGWLPTNGAQAPLLPRAERGTHQPPHEPLAADGAAHVPHAARDVEDQLSQGLLALQALAGNLAVSAKQIRSASPASGRRRRVCFPSVSSRTLASRENSETRTRRGFSRSLRAPPPVPSVCLPNVPILQRRKVRWPPRSQAGEEQTRVEPRSLIQSWRSCCHRPQGMASRAREEFCLLSWAVCPQAELCTHVHGTLPRGRAPRATSAARATHTLFPSENGSWIR